MNPDDEFSQIKYELVTEIKGMRSDLDRYMAIQAEHHKLLHGDPINKQRGLAQRLDTLEDGNIKKDQWNMVVIPAVITVFAERIFHYIWGKH